VVKVYKPKGSTPQKQEEGTEIMCENVQKLFKAAEKKTNKKNKN